jgi:hemin uptake protein HemP
MTPEGDGKGLAGDVDPVNPTTAITETNTPNGLRVIDSSDLLAGQSSLLIRHLGEVYRLQITRQGKLILTK